jgi:regulator of replication initiation timing
MMNHNTHFLPIRYTSPPVSDSSLPVTTIFLIFFSVAYLHHHLHIPHSKRVEEIESRLEKLEKENGDLRKQVEDLCEETRKWKDSDGEDKLFLVGHLNHILRRTGLWREEEEMTQCGKEDCFENFSQGIDEDSHVRVENEIRGLLGTVEHDTKDEAETQETVESPKNITHVVHDGVVAQNEAPGDLEGGLEEMRKLKNERRFKNRSTVRQDDFKAWREKNPDVVRKYSRRKLIKAQGVREMSMNIEDIMKEGKDPVSLGWL